MLINYKIKDQLADMFTKQIRIPMIKNQDM